jgi:hypothetical protein
LQEELLPAAIQARTERKVRSLVKAEKERRGLSRKKVREADDSDADPMEEIAIAALTEAEASLRIAAQTPITMPALRRKGHMTVVSLLKTAQRLQTQLQ